MPEYFIILVVLFFIALTLQVTLKVKIYHSLAHLFFTNLLGIIIISIWDNLAIYRGHWSFGRQFLLGPKIGLMPIEEYLFILIFPYLGLVVYKILEKKLKK